jgi:hypothetical protein
LEDLVLIDRNFDDRIAQIPRETINYFGYQMDEEPEPARARTATVVPRVSLKTARELKILRKRHVQLAAAQTDLTD